MLKLVQREVAVLLHVRVVAQAEVAAAHGHAAQRVAVAVHRVKVRAQQLVAQRRRQLLPGQRRGFGEGAAEAQQRLHAARGVHEHRRPRGGRAFVPGRTRRLFGQPLAAIAAAQPAAQARAHFDQWMPSTRIFGSPVVFSGLPVNEKRSAMMKRKFTSRRSSFGLAARKADTGIDTWHHWLVLQ